MTQERIEVDLGGRIRPFCFGEFSQKILEQFFTECPDYGKSEHELLSAVIYCGLLHGCMFDQIDPDFSCKTVENWLRELKAENSARFVLVVSDCEDLIMRSNIQLPYTKWN